MKLKVAPPTPDRLPDLDASAGSEAVAELHITVGSRRRTQPLSEEFASLAGVDQQSRDAALRVVLKRDQAAAIIHAKVGHRLGGLRRDDASKL